jgi:thymidylate kinase
MLIHAHVHYKLILGHDLTKNYHLAIEDSYLRSSAPGDFFRVPAPEFERIVLVIRMMLKHSTWEAFLGGQGRLSERERQEIEYLQSKAKREQTAQVLQECLPFLEWELFEACVRSLQPHCPRRARLRSGHQLQKALRGCRRRPRGVDIWLQFWRRLTMAAAGRLLRKTPRKRMKNGGMLVAFVGGDGAGKTTIIEAISDWLSPRFATRKFHLGKPSWSWLTVLIRSALKAGRVLGLYPFSKVSLEFRDEEAPVTFPGYPTLFRAVCTARDRSRSYLKARRQADRGVFVICDRFPLPRTISMDGPQIAWMTRGLPERRLVRSLGALESGYYRSIQAPDLLFVLRANPETAVERKQDESAVSVRARTKEIWKKDWQGTGAVVIDANQPKDEVVDKIKTLLWKNL